MSIRSKLFAFQSKPTASTFPELPDIIIWIRIVLGAAYGVNLGLKDEVGGVVLVFGLNLITFLPIVFMSTFLNVQIDTYKQSVNFAGVANALAVMLLVWMIIFTKQHGGEEAVLAAALVGQKVAGGADTVDVASRTAGEQIAESAADEGEF
jgi:hypothetical protein